MEVHKNIATKALCVLKLWIISLISALIKAWGTAIQKKKKKKGKIDRKIFNEMQAMVNEQNTKILTVFPLIMNSSHYNFYN